MRRIKWSEKMNGNPQVTVTHRSRMKNFVMRPCEQIWWFEGFTKHFESTWDFNSHFIVVRLLEKKAEFIKTIFQFSVSGLLEIKSFLARDFSEASTESFSFLMTKQIRLVFIISRHECSLHQHNQREMMKVLRCDVVVRLLLTFPKPNRVKNFHEMCTIK